MSALQTFLVLASPEMRNLLLKCKKQAFVSQNPTEMQNNRKLARKIDMTDERTAKCDYLGRKTSSEKLKTHYFSFICKIVRQYLCPY